MLLDSVPSGKTISDVFLQQPNKFMPLLSFAQSILREPGELDPKDREFIAAFTSSLNSCKFCTGSHKVFAISVGADEEELQNAIDGNYQNHRLKSILDYVKILTLNPSSITRSDVELVLKSGFTEEQLKEAIVVCAAFNMFNRIVEGHGVEENSATWQVSAEMINKFGYDRRGKTK
jgi:uncharacterized peroxidase-related enzyme